MPLRYHLTTFDKKRQSGNALFLILIAVALFAALSYAVTKSGRGGGTIGKEQAQLYAAQITQTAAMINQGYHRMLLSGVPAASIVTNNPTGTCEVGAGTANGQSNFCTSGTNCLFAPEGGGVAVPQMPRNAYGSNGIPFYPNFFTGPTGHNGIILDGLCPLAGGAGAAFPGVGTGSNDDVIQIDALKIEVCTAINKGLGISGIPATYPSGELAACYEDPHGVGACDCIFVVVAH